MDEIWTEVSGYEGRYLVSSFGRVYSIFAKRIIKTCISNAGYELACLQNSDGKRNQRTVHRLVAVAFLDNPNDLPIINHKDENKLNNHADNLEWCTCAYNNKYSGSIDKLIEFSKAKRIACDLYTKDGDFVQHFESVGAAARWLKTPMINVENAMRGYYKNKKFKTCKGYKIVRA